MLSSQHRGAFAKIAEREETLEDYLSEAKLFQLWLSNVNRDPELKAADLTAEFTEIYNLISRRGDAQRDDRECSKGYSCGNSCITRNKACLKSLTAEQKTLVNSLKGLARVQLSQELTAENQAAAAGQAGGTVEGSAGEFTASIEGFTGIGRDYFADEYAALEAAIGDKIAVKAAAEEKLKAVLDADEEYQAAIANRDEVISREDATLDESMAASRVIGDRYYAVVNEALSEEEQRLLEEGEDEIADAFNAFAVSLLDRSPVSEEQAQELLGDVDRLAVSDAFRRLARESGDIVRVSMSEDDINQALTDYIRLNAITDASQLPSEINEATSGRAYYDAENRGIYLDGTSDRGTFFHEMTHTLEAQDKELFAVGVEYRESRATSQEAEQLSEITGNDGYRSNEVALRGEYFNEYQGKVYSDYDHTEVLSMAIEQFGQASRPDNGIGWSSETDNGLALSELYKADRELFELAVGVMARRQTKFNA